MDGLNLSVVLPVFNEEECITEVLQELIDVLSSENITEFEKELRPLATHYGKNHNGLSKGVPKNCDGFSDGELV